MKMGIKEFRERLGEVAMGDEVVVLTHHGRRVGRYLPEAARKRQDVDVAAWVAERQEFARQWRSATSDWRERLRGIGFSAEEIAEMDADDPCC